MKTILLLILTLFVTNLCAQQLSQLPSIRNFQKNEYGALPQSWDIVQDKEGLMYFGNNHGLLQFDGEEWNRYPLPNKSIVRSLLYTYDTIYVGGQGIMGYFPLTGEKRLTFHSLSDRLHTIDFEDVWDIVKEQDGSIVFHSFQNDYRYHHNVFQKIPHYPGEFLFNVGTQLISSASLDFQNEHPPYQFIGTIQPQKLLLFTKDNGIFIHHKDNTKPFYPEKTKEIIEASIYSVISLNNFENNAHFAIGTVRNGVYILDEKGNIKAHYNKENGLANNTVLALFQDQNNELWCALDNGIAKIDLFSNVSYYSRNIHFTPSVYDAHLFKNEFYIGTNQGIYKRSSNAHQHEKVAGINDQVWNIFEWNNQLFVAHNKGLSILKKNTFELLFAEEGIWNGQPLRVAKGQLLLGTYKGFRLMNLNGEISPLIEGLDITARIFIQLANGEIWMSHGYKGVYKCTLSSSLKSFSNVTYYNHENGLPSSIFNNVFKVKESLYVGTLKGVYTYDEQQNSFHHSTNVQEFLVNDTTHIKYLKIDARNNFWLLSEKNFTTSSHNFSYVNNNFLGSFVAGFEFIYEYDQNKYIIGLEEGYALFTNYLYQRQHQPLTTYITSVKVGEQRSSETIHQQYQRKNDIEFENNSLQFSFSTPYFKNIDYNQYRFYLEGFDKGWSNWSNQSTKSYSFLNEGTYTFFVQSKNVNNQLSTPTSYTFHILPPWYRSFWAYSIYVFLFVAFFTFSILLVRHRAKREKKYLMIKQASEMQEMEYKLMKEVVDSKEEIDKLKNEALQSEIKNKNQELAAVTMAIMQKNQGLQSIKEALSDKYSTSKDKDLKKIIKQIDEATDVENDWDEFSIRFDQVYDNFFEKLKGKYPELTHRDVQICAYLKMKLSSKEIANTLNISVRSVEQSRYRLRKKMNIQHGENLLDRILGI